MFSFWCLQYWQNFDIAEKEKIYVDNQKSIHFYYWQFFHSTNEKIKICIELYQLVYCLCLHCVFALYCNGIFHVRVKKLSKATWTNIEIY